MIDKIIQERKKRYDKLNELLADPDVISNTTEYQSYAKEFAALTPLINLCNEYLKFSGDLNDMNEALSDKSHEVEFIALVAEERDKIKAKLSELEKSLENMILDKDSGSDRDIILEIRAGTGGVEASLFASDLLRMYSKYAARRGWKIELIDASTSEKGGYKEVICSISGSGVYGMMKFESGTHRVQRVPETEASGRIHTSAATVAVLPEAEELEIEIRPEDIKIDVFRSGGAGGQGVNRTDSAVRLTHLPSGLVVTCQDERSQLKNKAKALKVLRARLFDIQQTEQNNKLTKERRAQVGTGDRSEKIRTYNFPDRRVTDHRVGFTTHNLEGVLEGEIDELIEVLRAEERKLRLKAAS